MNANRRKMWEKVDVVEVRLERRGCAGSVCGMNAWCDHPPSLLATNSSLLCVVRGARCVSVQGHLPAVVVFEFEGMLFLFLDELFVRLSSVSHSSC